MTLRDQIAELTTENDRLRARNSALELENEGLRDTLTEKQWPTLLAIEDFEGAITRATRAVLDTMKSVPTICDGCRVNPPFEHRCHCPHGDEACCIVQGERVNKPCECAACAEVRKRFPR